MQSLIPQDVAADGNCWYHCISACIKSDAELAAAFDDRVDHQAIRQFVADLALQHGKERLKNLLEMVVGLPDLIHDYPFLLAALRQATEKNQISSSTEAMQLLTEACRQNGVWASEFEISLMTEALHKLGIRQVIITVEDQDSFASKSCLFEYDLYFALKAEDVTQLRCIVLARVLNQDHYQWVPFYQQGVIAIDDLLHHLDEVLDNSSVDQSICGDSEPEVEEKNSAADDDSTHLREVLNLDFLASIMKALQLE